MLAFRALFHRNAVEGELDEELRFHFDEQVEKYVRSGFSRSEAVQRARLAFGGMEQVNEECRDARGVALIETLVQDVRYGLRILRKGPGFTITAVLTLAVGIGVNTTLFTAFNIVALRPAPGKQSNRLVRLTRQVREGYGGSLFSDPEYLYYRNSNSVFSGLIVRSCCFDVVASGLPVSVASVDSGASGFHTLDDAVWFQKLPARVGAAIAVVLGSLALVLSAIGIYGIVSYVAGQRTREIGIRVALGANRAEVKLVLRQGAKLVAMGTMVGLAGSVAMAHVLASALAGDVGSPDVLFGLRSLDPVAFGTMSLLISGIALLACYIPARRATKVDPMMALRYE